jgi:hypothetical protein
MLVRWLWPELRDGRPVSTPTGFFVARSVAIALWLVLSAVNLVVWLMICLISGSWDDPWWLWSALVGALAVAGVCRVTRTRE